MRLRRLIQLTSQGVEVTASQSDLAEAREEFERSKLIHLPGLLSAELAERVRIGIAEDGFDEPDATAGGEGEVFVGAYAGVRQDLRQGHPVARLIADRTNDPRLLQFVQTIMGSAPLAKCIGHVARLFPTSEDFAWHTDAEAGRVADLVIELSAAPIEGGGFEMRDAETQEIFKTVDSIAFGDALLVRLSRDIEHHTKAITGSTPKVTFSGWFVPQQ